MANLGRSTIVIFLLLSACGLTTPAPVLPMVSHDAKPVPTVGTAVGIEGKIRKLDGSSVDLADARSKSQVVMFVSETCSVCRGETKTLVQDRATLGRPTNVEFYSILVGSVPDDAQDWSDGLNVNWTVATEQGDTLFRKYCAPELQTPCVILTNPATGKVQRLIGSHPLSDWEQITGTWSYQ